LILLTAGFLFYTMDIDQLRSYCLSFPGVTEDVKWGNDLVFSVGGKMFCVAGLETPLKFSFKIKDDDFEEISNSEGFMPAPYMARAKWVLVTQAKLNKKAYEQYVGQSYELVKAKLTKKVRTELGI